ncbi:uncharacterized protein ColSpa_03065 [Colletotrichum spaethianum]|uniref:Uncharacterized protein n=1 Tax=Colletotrichum spaethianum TaxID=700344 RepID=A0AA37LA74_9PEZI|nr:uncharacterized protein ColSpa_03065 [Colletotrichum spaethianum]GKT42884.1 hypothetical protein ColSpa_03065 [Colletotrichum spaethianum]
MQYLIMPQLICVPSLDMDILGDKGLFWKGMATYWLHNALSDPGMLANTLLWSCRHMATVRHREVCDLQATKYRLECIQCLNQTLTKEGNDISDLTIAKTLALASDSNLTGEHDIAAKHINAVGHMIRIRDEGQGSSDSLGRLVIWFTDDKNSENMLGSANLSFGTEMTPVAKQSAVHDATQDDKIAATPPTANADPEKAADTCHNSGGGAAHETTGITVFYARACGGITSVLATKAYLSARLHVLLEGPYPSFGPHPPHNSPTAPISSASPVA